MAFRIGVRGCQHLGYAPHGIRRRHEPTGLNQRVIDGRVAHRLTVEQMLDANVDGIIDGGDLFDGPRPLPGEIAHAADVDRLRAGGGAWLIANSGNHDAGPGGQVSATATMHHPPLDAHAVCPGLTGRLGPHPGYYEIHEPSPGVRLHVVSHHGLARDLADRTGQGVDPHPFGLPGVDLLFAHGIYTADPRLAMFGARTPNRVVPVEWVERPWQAVILSDFHTLGPVPGAANRVWYTGSAVRRGFADNEADRGWVLVTIGDDWRVTLDARPVWQRPQADLPAVDAAGRTVEGIDRTVRANLAAESWTDPESARLTGDGGWLLRQRIVGATLAQRGALASLRPRWDTAARAALWWEADDCAQPATEAVHSGMGREFGGPATDLAAELDARARTGHVGKLLAEVPDAERAGTLTAARAVLSDSDGRAAA